MKRLEESKYNLLNKAQLALLIKKSESTVGKHLSSARVNDKVIDTRNKTADLLEEIAEDLRIEESQAAA